MSGRTTRRGDTSPPTTHYIRKAKANALAHINQSRAVAGLSPLPRVSPLWWKIYGDAWVKAVLKEKSK